MRKQRPSRRDLGRRQRKLLNCATAAAPRVAMAVAVGRDGLLAAGATDVGRARDGNEDAYFVAADRGCFIVADGMGGHAAGDVASALAVCTIAAALTPAALGAASVEATLADAVRGAHQAILDDVAAHPGHAGMGAAVVVAQVAGRTLYVANVGDCRAYLCRQGAIRCLSRDHSMAAFLVEQGLLSPDAARDHPARAQLLAALGVARPEVIAQCDLALETGDRLLLCSDGLWGMLDDAELLATVSAAADPAAAVQTLIARANAAGGDDNITAVVIVITDADRLKGAERAWDALDQPADAERANAPQRQRRAEIPAVDV